MPYNTLATSKTPALIIYVLDVSYSMNEPLGDKRRIDVVSQALQEALYRMVGLSTRGTTISPRYRVAMIPYSDHVWDLLGGAQTIDKVADLGVPDLEVRERTDTAKAFLEVRKLLERELPRLGNCPAPIVCHMTDGHFTGDDPEPIARSIMQMRVGDGNVLLENIFISDSVLAEPIGNPNQWSGVRPSTRLVDDYAQKLRAMSSPLPDGYRAVMESAGYSLAADSLMMLPGTSPDLVKMGFVMSTSTPTTTPASRVPAVVDA